MGSIFGAAKKGFGKALKPKFNVLRPKPTSGFSQTKEYKMEKQRKLAQAKVKLKAMQKVDKDVEAGYKSVTKKGD